MIDHVILRCYVRIVEAAIWQVKNRVQRLA